MSTDWDQLLDQMEQRLAAAEGVEAGGTDRVEPFLPPSDLGRLPEHLRDRAVAILEATMAMERRLSAGMGELAARIGPGAPGRPAADRPPPSYVNQIA